MVMLSVLLVACSGASSEPAPSDMTVAVERPLSSCPISLSATNGHACAAEEMVCTIPVMCTTTYQQVRCKCENGLFSCADAIGKLAAHDPARCESGPSDDASTCPASFDTAEGAPCKDVGKSCAYPGAECANLPIRLTDYCQCKRNPVDGAMTLACKTSACPPQ